MNRTRLLVAFACVVPIVGCSDRPLEGPPEIRVGHDSCAECGMLLSEDRCCAAVLVEGSAGREHRIFDDIGCLLDWERSRASASASDQAEGGEDLRVLGRFVRDYSTRTWLVAEDARFVDGSAVVTPMASGLLGFRDPVAAEASITSAGGRIRLWPELAEARRAWFIRRDEAFRERVERQAAEADRAAKPREEE
jgi:copper chaperone NosL